VKERGRWSRRALIAYFCIFLLFLYGPMIVMAVLSFQGPFGGISFPLRGFGFDWWRSLVDQSVPFSTADDIRETAARSLRLAIVAGLLVALFSLGLSMAFRRRFRGDGVLFYLVMLALMTPGVLLSLGTSLFWQTLGWLPGLWQTALGTNVVWGLPFGFLVMVAVWNRYDVRVEEAARDLGANAWQTLREVTLPLIWTGLFGAFLFGFTLSWNEYDRTVLVLGSGQATLPLHIVSLTLASVIRPDLYALGTATTAVSLIAVGIFLVVAAIILRRRGREVSAETQEAEELGELPGVDVDADSAAGAPARAR
jgi:putative spermidine/putrescine transport system permease protein